MLEGVVWWWLVGGYVIFSGEPPVRKSGFFKSSKSEADTKRPWQGQIMGGARAWQTAADEWK